MTFTIDTIVVPQGAEYQAVCQGLKQAHSQDIKVVSIPIGTKDVLQTLINRSFEFISPQRVLIMGLCGSLNSNQTVGDRILYRNCCNADNDCLDLDQGLTKTIQQKLLLNLHTGLTSERPICQVEEKLKLGHEYSAEAIDMEGYGYIKELQRQGMLIAMLRIVSDDARGDIPDLSLVIDNNGSLNSWEMAILMVQNPWESIRLIKGSLTGLAQLRRVTKELFTKDI